MTEAIKSSNSQNSRNVITPEFRVSYPYLFRPAPNMDKTKTEEKYSITMVFAPGTDLSALKREAERAVSEKWGPDKTKWPSNLRNPIRKNEEKLKEGKLPDGYLESGFFITATSKQQPGVVDQKVQPIIEDHQIYAGCYARASVRAFTYDRNGNKGVAFGLQNVQKLRDGDPISGRAQPSSDFDEAGDMGTATTASIWD